MTSPEIARPDIDDVHTNALALSALRQELRMRPLGASGQNPAGAPELFTPNSEASRSEEAALPQAVRDYAIEMHDPTDAELAALAEAFGTYDKLYKRPQKWEGDHSDHVDITLPYQLVDDYFAIEELMYNQSKAADTTPFAEREHVTANILARSRELALRFSPEEVAPLFDNSLLRELLTQKGVEGDELEAVVDDVTLSRKLTLIQSNRSDPAASFERMADNYLALREKKAHLDAADQPVFTTALMVQVSIMAPESCEQLFDDATETVRWIKDRAPELAPYMTTLLSKTMGRGQNSLEAAQTAHAVIQEVGGVPAGVAGSEFVKRVITSRGNRAELSKGVSELMIGGEAALQALDEAQPTRSAREMPLSERVRQALDDTHPSYLYYIAASGPEFADSVVNVSQRLNPESFNEVLSDLAEIHTHVNAIHRRFEAAGQDEYGVGFARSAIKQATKALVALDKVLAGQDLPQEIKGHEFTPPTIDDCFDAVAYLRDVVRRYDTAISDTQLELLSDADGVHTYTSKTAHAVLSFKPEGNNLRAEGREYGKGAHLNVILFDAEDMLTDDVGNAGRRRAFSLRIDREGYDLEDDDTRTKNHQGKFGEVAVDFGGLHEGTEGVGRTLTTVLSLGDYYLYRGREDASVNYYNMRGEFSDELGERERFAEMVDALNKQTS